MLCAACTTDVPDDDLFCENCGVRLQPETASAAGCTCGAPPEELDEEGFCLSCGRRVRRPDSDHIEDVLGEDFAAVSDRGQRHERNEDRFALTRVGQISIAVVCDGVSSTSNADVASAAVSAAVVREARGAFTADAGRDPEHVLQAAVAAAAAELKVQTAVDLGDSAPSTTLVAAVVSNETITVAWLGDSRAYWIDKDGAHPLTHDHSWMNMVLASGEMTEEEAQASPQAHAITRWLGADAETASTLEFVEHKITGEGTLLLCTDGLWNYASAPATVAELINNTDGQDSLSAARKLVDYANQQGGRDNITVALLRLRPSTPAADADPVNLEA